MLFKNNEASWIFEPKTYTISDEKIVIKTEPRTDLWQRTYYGFQNNNAPALLVSTKEKEFSFLVKTQFDSNHRFDQCGVIIYQDSDNWFKASIEYQNEEYQRLGSVVTNYGYSDWATTDISAKYKQMYYRLSRRENDYCIENSYDGVNFKQMRIFHLFKASDEIRMGIYACSPEESSFNAVFTQIKFTECKWPIHK
ncbi:DUF1349 domain-containing protein [Clostridium botulinum]|uniref:DUF1349 domain-containing protein n=1 Tax=Clostridium botulinum (strain Eklund 17B / Type B) TaxID=935198 RepID=B2TM70_CLOBB|nr:MULTISPECIES: DUF1349 domain-containing protein [Clostridium]ACD22238.1 conserved hypothetical protein [Clostridium botulinum B str. Eklund 17B (NRP)]KFX56235.1 hypothetical protein KU41_17995 [Clostridium botulinum]MBN1055461.1 DUF1349 domain-containing protein [Clostridium botulinum]MBY6804451.1 DUF1349 domain-containing protein [Clostridium botulinum]MBY6813413.1 DUF1349 domain-containing protein [Clostridium botulinum]